MTLCREVLEEHDPLTQTLRSLEASRSAKVHVACWSAVYRSRTSNLAMHVIELFWLSAVWNLEPLQFVPFPTHAQQSERWHQDLTRGTLRTVASLNSLQDQAPPR